MSREEIWTQWTDFCFADGQGTGKQNELWNNLESAGYNCDFEVADILAKIQNCGGEASFRMIYDGSGKHRIKGGAERLRKKLAELVEEGQLTVRYEEAGNGTMVAYYRIPAGQKLGDAYDEFC